MKTLKYLGIIFLVALIWSCKVHKNGLNQLSNYRSLASFKGDTVGYVKYNFIDNKRRYLNNPLEKLTRQCELPINNFVRGEHTIDFKKMADIELKLFDYDAEQQRIRQKKNPLILIIDFEKPIPVDSAIAATRKEGRTWGNAAQQFYGKRIVKNIRWSVY